MASSRTYKVRGLVLRKTKLGEKDLIVTMIAQDGSLIRAVAKGARKPGGSFAARAELFSTLDCLVARGRNLDVLSETRFAREGGARSFGLEQTACASTVAELLCSVAQEGLEHPRLFEMSEVAFDAIAQADPPCALALAAAALIKIMASEGLRPSFDVCVSCGQDLEQAGQGRDGWISVSFEDGGAVCGSCAHEANAIPVEADVVAWTRVLLYKRFSEISENPPDLVTTFGILQFTRQWCRTHAGRNLKSLDFLFTSGLF